MLAVLVDFASNTPSSDLEQAGANRLIRRQTTDFRPTRTFAVDWREALLGKGHLHIQKFRRVGHRMPFEYTQNAHVSTS